MSDPTGSFSLDTRNRNPIPVSAAMTGFNSGMLNERLTLDDPIVFFGKGDRGAACLTALIREGFRVDLVVSQAPANKDGIAQIAQIHSLDVVSPPDPNTPQFVEFLSSRKPCLFILAGYGTILSESLLSIPQVMSINLHAGKLPQYRGSSPLNWALINGETSVGLSVIEVDKGVDTGAVLLEQDFPVGLDTTVAELHALANTHFPKMMLCVLQQLIDGGLSRRPQLGKNRKYWPLRRPEDGLFFWDCKTATEIHNMVRGLTEPYPCARTFFAGRLVRIIETARTESPVHGYHGRIYAVNANGALTCAADQCVWVKRAVFHESGEDLMPFLKRYDSFDTLHSIAAKTYEATATKQVES